MDAQLSALMVQLQERRHRAMVDADVPALDLLLDEVLVYTHSDGSRDGKSSYLRKVGEGLMRYDEVSAIDQEVVSLGDAACVVGRMRLGGWRDGVEKRLDNRFLAVWVRRQKGWRLAAFQPTPVTSSPEAGPESFAAGHRN